MRIDVRPALVRWARERAGLELTELEARFPRIAEWERGETKPTLKQLETFAKVTRTPTGYLFLEVPPVEVVPIPDFRTMGNVAVPRPSPDLLETIYICQQRQEWYRDFVRSTGEDAVPVVGSVNLKVDVIAAAEVMRNALGFDIERRRKQPTWSEALREFIGQADGLGILVMCSGIVGSNTHRGLDPEEFRGFAIADPLAPLVFINGADTRSAQMFTLAHELAHIWLGQTALSDANARSLPSHDIERWCNRVAAELLVPLEALRRTFDPDATLETEVSRLARRFKVSTLVVLRRIHDVGALTWEELWEAYDREVERLLKIPRGSGGNFYLTLPARVSKRFARALVTSTLEGQTLYRDAFQMLGFSKVSTFEELGRTLGVVA
jgi:Zn-dependent peptidase ImmA (M78 family)